jgi:N-acetylmuramoyl-L-alanine amidase
VRTPSGILALVHGADAAGAFVVSTPCDRRVTVPAAASQIVRRIDVLLDPGHGGLDPGATGPNGMTEAEINLDVAQRTAQLLRARGVTVELTRDDDHFRTIADRAQLAVAIAPKAFVSIHHNGGIASPVRGPIGSEVYHQVADDESRRLGGLVYESLEVELGALDAAWTRSARWGVRARTNSEGTDFYGVLRRSAGVPAVLIEGAYMSSAQEAALLATDAFRDAEARAIATGIARWLTSPDPGTGYQRGFAEDGTGGNTDLRTCRDPLLDQPRR